MGTLTFQLPAGLSSETNRELERACVAGGPDSMPWPTRVKVEHGRLILERDVDESGFVVVPWAIDGAGQLMAGTATLMERAAPYHFQLELARGKVNQLRSQTADWKAGGLEVGPALIEQIALASRTFGHAVTAGNPELAGAQAQEALLLTARAAEDLTRLYLNQVFEVRHQREPRLGTALGCRLRQPLADDAAQTLLPALNSVAVQFPWSEIEASEGSFNWQQADAAIEWAENHGIPATGGPVVDFSAGMLPDWLWSHERDRTGLAKYMSLYLAAVLKRYRRRIRRWHLTSASNSATVLSLGEEELLWITIRLAQVARQIDPTLELVVGVTQPWGEYMALEERTHSPFIFADTLIRSELGLAALDVEIVMGVAGRGSYCRDLLETSRLLDLYSLLGVPLRVTLGFPYSGHHDPSADTELRLDAGRWHGPFSPATQAEWARAFAALALCKPYVQAVHWVQTSDAAPHQFPNCGLFNAAGVASPALQELSKLRTEHLN